MQIERHVFGSYKGYTTLARSPGVSMDDCRVVERCAYSFGQTYESRYYRSLGKKPAWFTQVFPGNRRGLTRVTEGPADDQGRPTLCFITAILSRRDWDATLLGDIGALADCRTVWAWDESGTIASLNLEIPGAMAVPAKVRSLALQLISQLERQAASRRPVSAAEDGISLDAVRAVEMLLPPAVRNTVTTSFRILSPQFPALLNVLADEVGSAATYRPDERQPLSPYAQALKLGGLDSGNAPLSIITGYRSFGTQPAQAGGLPAMPSTQFVAEVETVYRTRRWPAIGAAVGGIALGFLAGYLGRDAAIERQMRAKGLEWADSRWLTPEEKQRAERTAAGQVEVGGKWVKREAKEAEEKALIQREQAKEQAIDKRMVWYKDQWLTIERAYETKQRDSGLDLFEGLWLTEEQRRNAQGKLWNGTEWVSVEAIARGYLKGLEMYEGGWLTPQQVKNEKAFPELMNRMQQALGQRQASTSAGADPAKASDGTGSRITVDHPGSADAGPKAEDKR